MDDLSDIAAEVEARAESLMGPDEEITLDRQFVIDCIKANERGDGCLFAALNGKKCLYNVTRKPAGQWYYWNDVVWEEDVYRKTVAEVEYCAMEYDLLIEGMNREIEEEDITSKKHSDFWKVKFRDSVVARAKRLRSTSGVAKALDWAPVVDMSLACEERDFDQEKWLLPCKNGVIDLRTGVLTDGRPGDMLTRQIDVEYDPRADYADWVAVIEEICDSKEIAAFIKRLMGYAITGNTKEQNIFVFVGPGRNGKGIMFSLIGEVMGPYYHEINPGMILEQRNEPSPAAASEHKYSLLGKRIIVGAETNKNKRIDAQAVKSLTGEDKITCRPNFSAEFSFSPTHTLFLHTNHLPTGLTSDFALLQRLLRIEFPFMYVDDVDAEKKKHPGQKDRFRKKDPDLKDKLRENKQGILRWLVEGCREWQEVGLSPPQSILDGVDALAREEDYMGQFIDDCLVHHPGDPARKISCRDMYISFSWWWGQNMDSNVKRIPAMKTINKAMRERGYDISKLSGRTWVFEHTINPEILTRMGETGDT